jgi:hypothetical protein
MTSFFLTLLAPVLVLWIGACVFYVLDRLVPPQDAGVAEALLLCLALGALLWGAILPGEGTPGTELSLAGAWEEAGWPGRAPALRADRQNKGLAAILMVTTAAAALASLAESGVQPGRGGVDPRVAGRGGRVGALGAALVFLFAGDWATMALAWVVGDLLLLYARLAQPPSEDKDASATSWTLVLSLLGAVCLGLAVVVRPEEGQAPGALGTGLALAAIVLRLLPFPLFSWSLPFARQHTLYARVFSFLVPTLLGAHLCSQVVPWAWSAELGAEGGQWLAALRGTVWGLWAAVALLISAFKAWSAREPGACIQSATLYATALIVLGAALNLPAEWLRVVGVSAVLSVCALIVSWTQCPYLDPANPRSWWRVAPAGIALLALGGVPLTLGFPAHAALYTTLLSAERWLLLPPLIVAQAGLLGALLRVLLDVECVLPESDGHPEGIPAPPHPRAWQREVAYGAGAVLALCILLLGVLPQWLGAPGLGAWLGVPSVPVWAAMLLPAVGAVLLYRDQERISVWMEGWAPFLERVLDGRWLARGVESVLRGVTAVVWNGSQVIEGAGYMAWVTLFGLVILLLVLAHR